MFFVLVFTVLLPLLNIQMSWWKRVYFDDDKKVPILVIYNHVFTGDIDVGIVILRLNGANGCVVAVVEWEEIVYWEEVVDWGIEVTEVEDAWLICVWWSDWSNSWFRFFVARAKINAFNQYFKIENSKDQKRFSNSQKTFEFPKTFSNSRSRSFRTHLEPEENHVYQFRTFSSLKCHFNCLKVTRC